MFSRAQILVYIFLYFSSQSTATFQFTQMRHFTQFRQDTDRQKRIFRNHRNNQFYATIEWKIFCFRWRWTHSIDWNGNSKEIFSFLSFSVVVVKRKWNKIQFAVDRRKVVGCSHFVWLFSREFFVDFHSYPLVHGKLYVHKIDWIYFYYIFLVEVQRMTVVTSIWLRTNTIELVFDI